MIKIKTKISPSGNSYHILIPKALVECGVLKAGEELEFVVQKPNGEQIDIDTTKELELLKLSPSSFCKKTQNLYIFSDILTKNGNILTKNSSKNTEKGHNLYTTKEII